VAFHDAILARSVLEASALALFISQQILQIFSDLSSHRIFRRMHAILNIDEKKN